MKPTIHAIDTNREIWFNGSKLKNALLSSLNKGEKRVHSAHIILSCGTLSEKILVD